MGLVSSNLVMPGQSECPVNFQHHLTEPIRSCSSILILFILSLRFLFVCLGLVFVFCWSSNPGPHKTLGKHPAAEPHPGPVIEFSELQRMTHGVNCCSVESLRHHPV